MTRPATLPDMPGAPAHAGTLHALVVDDEQPALSELAWLLGRDPRVATVRTAASATEALRSLEAEATDVVFTDISMPGLDGLDLARVLARFARPPQVVFVTAHDQHAIQAFDLRATDYVMKPVRPQRLAEAVRRVLERTGPPAPEEGPPAGDETIAVELGGVTRFVLRSQVRYVEAQGDYARLHTEHGSHLVRVPLSVLEERWAGSGFVRIHRSTLVALAHVEELRLDEGRCTVRLGGQVLQVSRRHTKEVRDRMVRASRLTRAEQEGGPR